MPEETRLAWRPLGSDNELDKELTPIFRARYEDLSKATVILRDAEDVAFLDGIKFTARQLGYVEIANSIEEMMDVLQSGSFNEIEIF